MLGYAEKESEAHIAAVARGQSVCDIVVLRAREEVIERFDSRLLEVNLIRALYVWT